MFKIKTFKKNQGSTSAVMHLTATESKICVDTYVLNKFAAIVPNQTANDLLSVEEKFTDFSKISHNGAVFELVQSNVIDLQDLSNFGYDEVVDYSIMSLGLGSTVWVNTLIETLQQKIINKQRHENVANLTRPLTLTLPFVKSTFDDATLYVNSEFVHFVTNLETEALESFDENYSQDLWHVDIQLEEENDSTVTFSYQLKWNRDDSNCTNETKLQIESTGGYLPKKFTTSDAAGTGSFKIMTTGLESGDVIKIKLNAKHYTNLGSIDYQVK